MPVRTQKQRNGETENHLGLNEGDKMELAQDREVGGFGVASCLPEPPPPPPPAASALLSLLFSAQFIS